jgi:hypothetical protein
MRFRNCVIDKDIASAIVEANRLLSVNSPMIDELKLKNDFKYASGSGEEVVKKLLAPTEPVSVFIYRPWNKWSSALGYFDGKSIFVNVRKLPINRADLVGLLCHEFAHYAGFNHGNNYKTNDKILFSVPYFISENVRKWI